MKMIIPMDLMIKQGGAQNRKDAAAAAMIDVEGIGNLPRDLIIEILSRLPVKTLSRFRCVSKEWLHLLSHDHHFVARHHQRSRDKPLLLFRKYYSGEIKQEINDKVVVELTAIDMDGDVVTKLRAPVGGPVYTFTSCGPLILLCCPYRVYVCNPSTQEILRVPLSVAVPRYCTVGFGYLPSSHQYKIVHLFPIDSFVGDEQVGCEIFSLAKSEDVNSGSWRRIGDCPFKVRTNGLPVCVGGFIYWMVSEEDQASQLEKKSILSFDLEKEEFGAISYPKCYSDCEHSFLFLTGFKNCLCLVDCSARTSVTDIWLLKDRKDSSTWAKSYSFSLSEFDANIQIRGIVPSDAHEGDLLINTEHHGILHYNIETNTVKRVMSDVEERYKLPCIYYDGFCSLRT